MLYTSYKHELSTIVNNVWRPLCPVMRDISPKGENIQCHLITLQLNIAELAPFQGGWGATQRGRVIIYKKVPLFPLEERGI